MYREFILKNFHKAYTFRTRMVADRTIVRIIAFYIYEAFRYITLDTSATKYNGEFTLELGDLIDLISHRLTDDKIKYLLMVNSLFLPFLVGTAVSDTVPVFFDEYLTDIINYLDGKPAQFVEETDTVIISALMHDDSIDTICFCFPTEGV